MKKTILSFLIFYSFSLQAQDLKKIEQDLVYYLKRINFWSAYNGSDKNLNPLDSLQKANGIFEQKLINYTSKQPLTLTYDFMDLQEESITIASSADKKMRIYSWDTKEGGTMHLFKNVFQYQSGNSVFSKKPKNKEGDSGGWFSEIFTLNKNGKNVYLGYYNAIYSTRDAYQGVKSFSIDKNILDDTYRLIKTKTGLKNGLGFDFDFFSVVDRKERPVKLIYFDSTRKTLKIPIVTDKGIVTNKFIVYTFKGNYFER